MANGEEHAHLPQKVFVIGLSKTGTTTLKHMLSELGYHVCGPKKQLLRSIRAGNISAIDPYLNEYDAFEDWPWPLTYRYTFEKYAGEVRYILTKRSSSEKWFNSVLNHGRGMHPLKSMADAYGYYRPFGRKQEFIDAYEAHNTEVQAFFADKSDIFLEFCLENGDGWEKLASFLNFSAPDQPVPHRNRTSDQRRLVNNIINKAIEPIYGMVAALGRLGR